jgi:hypothetical protein
MVDGAEARSAAAEAPSAAPRGDKRGEGAPAEPSRRVWIDCDAGIDDAQALLLALSLPGVEVVAVR